MASMHDKIRAANVMSDDERAELLSKGWQPEVIEALFVRGFRPCKPDYVSARFEGISRDRTMGFLRQTCMPHLHITVARDELVHVVMERIDTAIFDAGRLSGHEWIAGLFMRFFESVKAWQPAAQIDTAAMLKRLEALEAKSKEHE